MTNQPLWDLPSNHDRLAEHVDLSGRLAVDVGCGAGELVRFMRSHGASPIGVECGEAMIRQARDADEEYADAYLDGVGQDLPLESATVDLVVFSYSLHHVPVEHMATALAEAERVLKPGGELVVLEPIAEGPGFQTHQPVDDETIVRAHAQEALNSSVTGSLMETGTHSYTTSYSYRDVDELERTVVDIDPSRRKAFDASRDEVRARFETLGEKHADRHWFAQPVLMRIFAKRFDSNG